MAKITIPTYDALMNPLIQALKSLGGSGTVEVITNKVAEIAGVTDEQLEVLHDPDKGGVTEVEYRLAWSRTWLKRYGPLEKELALFPKLKVLMLMGDVAIKAINSIARRAGEARVIPAIPTYKLRGQGFHFRGKRVFPSYLQAGPSFFIEKSKRKMIAEDIAAALRLAR